MEDVRFKKTEIGVIPEHWDVSSVGKVGKVITGKTPPTNNHEYYGDDYPFVRIPDMVNSVYIKKTNTRISQKGANYLGKIKLPKNSIMVSCIATIGNVGTTSEESFTNQQINSLIPNPHIADFKYLYYFFKNNKELLESLGGGGSVYSNISKSKFENMLVVLPNVMEQKQIAEILSSLDDKIELNRKINSNLEKIASLLFKQWFIDIKGKDFKIRKLGDFFPIKTGKKDANIATKNGKYPFFTCSQDILFTDNFSFDSSSILLAGNGDFNIKWYEGKFEAYQRTYVLTPYKKELLGFLYFLMNYFLDDITVGHKGSVIKFITKGMIEDFEVKIPMNKDFNNKAKFFYEIIQVIDFYEKEIKNLSQIRDFLLPRLMSGKIRVKI